MKTKQISDAKIIAAVKTLTEVGWLHWHADNPRPYGLRAPSAEINVGLDSLPRLICAVKPHDGKYGEGAAPAAIPPRDRPFFDNLRRRLKPSPLAVAPAPGLQATSNRGDASARKR
jgi:hypothetical protein